MSPKPIRARRFTLDLHLDDDRPPQPGDIHITARAVYRVVDARPVESRVWGNRWCVSHVRIGDAVDHQPTTPVLCDPGARRFVSSRYQPGETPAEFFGRLAAGRT